MKWIGQHIWSLISRFRSDVYLESLDTTTETDVLVVDSTGKVSKSTSVAGDLTSIIAGTGLSGTSLTGPIPTLNVDSSQQQITEIGEVVVGTWRGTPINTAYINDNAITEDKLGDTLLAEIDGTIIVANAALPKAGGALTGTVTSTHDISALTFNGVPITEIATENLGIGDGSLGSITTGDYNVGIGDNSLTSTTIGDNNTSIGYNALNTNTEGSANTANGFSSLGDNIDGIKNTAIGNNSLSHNTTGDLNIGVGYRAGDAITTGSNNTILGEYYGTTTLADTVAIAAGTTERLKVNATGLYINTGTLAVLTDTVYTHPNHTGHITSSGDGALTIANDVVTEDMLVDTLLAEIDANTAKETNVVQTTITGNAGTATALVDGNQTITGNLTVNASSSTGNPLLTFTQNGTRGAFIQLADNSGGYTNNLRINSEYGAITLGAASTNGVDSDTAYLTVEPTGIFKFGAVDSDAVLTTDGNMTFRIDTDNNEASQKFAFQNNISTEIASLNDGGDLMITGDIELGHVSDTTISRSGAGVVTIEGAVINTQSLTIKILPSDFMPDDGGRPAMIDDTSGDRWLESHGTLKLFAFVHIPSGFKATDVYIYGSATSAITVYEADINSATVTSKGTGNIGTSINITDVTADTTNYIMIELAQASGERVYGGRMTIAAV